MRLSELTWAHAKGAGECLREIIGIAKPGGIGYFRNAQQTGMHQHFSRLLQPVFPYHLAGCITEQGTHFAVKLRYAHVEKACYIFYSEFWF